MSLVTLAGVVSGAPKKAPEPTLPVPEVRLEVKAGEAGKPWTVRVTNAGSSALRVVADARLLRLEIEPKAEAPDPKSKKKKKGPKTFTCELPSSMRSDGRTLELAPGESYQEAFDVRLFCLDRAKELVEGVKVTPRYGWSAPKKGKLGKPFVVEATKDDVAAAKEIAQASFELAADAEGGTKGDKSLAGLVARPGVAHSVLAGRDVSTTIIVKNESSETKTLYPRPQLVDAKVLGPRGVVTNCSGPAITPAPLVDFVTKLPKNGTWSSTVTLDNFCPQGTFDVPGLYLVIPAVHLPAVPNVSDAVTGDLTATTPQLLRVETGTKPFHEKPPTVAK